MTKFGDTRIVYETQKQQYITIEGLFNWTRCYLITDNCLLELPAELINQLGGHLQKRWIDLNKEWYKINLKERE